MNYRQHLGACKFRHIVIKYYKTGKFIIRLFIQIFDYRFTISNLIQICFGLYVCDNVFNQFQIFKVIICHKNF